ncbi:hypothetical protein Cgig2_028256 [Carnegiea gigantea]|uniref:Uncharacterized protein n=1 Tax=Carnegiea gigantea TaxID=171969 RepID=A0A9Q1GNK4_9CARY|nr:hypothetical protein Cgig2_028256 [Carnegiea gigantea]
MKGLALTVKSRCPEGTRLLLSDEDHLKISGTITCHERRALCGCALKNTMWVCFDPFSEAELNVNKVNSIGLNLLSASREKLHFDKISISDLISLRYANPRDSPLAFDSIGQKKKGEKSRHERKKKYTMKIAQWWEFGKVGKIEFYKKKERKC